MSPEEQHRIIKDNYENIFSGEFDIGKKEYIGPTRPSICRFCKKSEPEISFKNISHAIPEFLGNRQLICRDECDSCNTFFSQNIETHLDKFTKPYRVMANVRGKKGSPSYKTKNKQSRTDWDGNGTLILKQCVDTPMIVLSDDKVSYLQVYEVEKYIPCGMYKALVKIALSVIPHSELIGFSHAIRWIRESDHSKQLMNPLNAFLSFVPGFKPYRKLAIRVLRKKENKKEISLPHCMLVIAFGNIQIQIIVPYANDANKGSEAYEFQFPRYLTGFEENWPFGSPTFKLSDFSNNMEISPKPLEVKIRFDRVEENQKEPKGSASEPSSHI